MTKKDYIKIAIGISNASLSPAQRLSVVAEIGIELSKDNPKFNYDIFKEACFVGCDKVPGQDRK